MSYFFDSTEVDRDPTCELIDEGTYTVQIVKARNNIDNFGQKLRVYYKVLSPEAFKDKHIMDNFNLGHSKEDVQRIGKEQFARVLDCIGLVKIATEQEIVGKQLKLEIKVVPHYKDPSQEQNKIIRHLPLTYIDLNLQKQQKSVNKPADDVPF